MPDVVVDRLVTEDRGDLTEPLVEDGANGDSVQDRPLLGGEVDDRDRLASRRDCAAQGVLGTDVGSVLQALYPISV